MTAYSLENLGKSHFEGGASEFVDHLLIALSASGVNEIWRGNEDRRPAARFLNEALCVINAHVGKMLEHSQDLQRHPEKMRGYMKIGHAVAASNIGTFDYFWHYVAHSGANWYMDGRYLMPYSPPHARQILENDFEKWYRRLVCGYARLIRRRIQGR